MLNCDVHIALEWPRKCRYWNLTKVSKLLIQYDMVTYNFDGCALGTKDQVGIPLEEALDCGLQAIRKPCPGHCHCWQRRWGAARPSKGVQRYNEYPRQAAQRESCDPDHRLSRTVRYDKVHMEDETINRKLVTSFLKAVIDCHLSYLKLIGIDDHLRKLPRIEDLTELKEYPNLLAFKMAFKLEIDSNVSSLKDIPRMPDLEQKMAETDEEIWQWVLQAEAVTTTAAWEVEPMIKEIAEEDQALEPMNIANADSDDKLVKIKAITVDDRLDARRRIFSEHPGQKWQDPSYAPEEEDFEFTGWDLVPEAKRTPRVVASNPIVEEEKELDLDDLVR